MTTPTKPINATAATALFLSLAFGSASAAQAGELPAVNADDAQMPSLRPTLDTDGDGAPDAWDRDQDGKPDAWDTDGDGKPDQFDDNADGKPD